MFENTQNWSKSDFGLNFSLQFAQLLGEVSPNFGAGDGKLYDFAKINSQERKSFTSSDLLRRSLAGRSSTGETVQRFEAFRRYAIEEGCR